MDVVDAARANDLAAVRACLARGGSVVGSDDQGSGALAVRHGDAAMTEALLRHGAPWPTRRSGLDTPLHWAALRDHGVCCGLLLAVGADVRVVDDRCWTPLRGAVGLCGLRAAAAGCRL